MKKIHLLLIIFFFTPCLFISCATHEKQKKFSKDDFIKKLNFSVLEQDVKQNLLNMPDNDRWNNCFDLTDEEFIEVIIPIYRECFERGIERNSKNLPEFITAEQAKSLTYGVDTCAKTRFIIRNKDKFSLEKTPETFDRCLDMYEKLIKKIE